jgi:DNA-binding XRE family transcriptional regulator
MRNKLEHYRTLKGLSRSELAKAVDIDRTVVWRYEKGLARPRDEVKERISETLGVSIEELFFNKTVA